MGQCTANSKRSGVRCKRYAAKGRTVCSMHGGKSLQGAEAGQFKHGRYSRYLPDRLAEQYAMALADEDLGTLVNEIALMDTRLQDVLGRLQEGGEGPAAWAQAQAAFSALRRGVLGQDQATIRVALGNMEEAMARGRGEASAWGEVTNLVEQRRKLVDTERRRLLDEDHAVAIDKLMLLMAAVVDIVRRHVASKEARSAISNEIRGLVAGSGGAGNGDLT